MMKTDKQKHPGKPANPAEKERRKAAGNTGDMTIEEAREAEKAFNEELEIFKEVARMNRKAKD